MNFKPLFKNKRASIEWTAYVLEAVGKAKKYNKPVFLDVGRESTAFMMEYALLNLAMNGEAAAWRVEVRLHTLQ